MALRQEDIKERGNRLHRTGTVGDNFDAQALPICRVRMLIMMTHVMTVNNFVSHAKPTCQGPQHQTELISFPNITKDECRDWLRHCECE